MFIGRSLNASLSQLGTLTLVRALFQASGSCAGCPSLRGMLQGGLHLPRLAAWHTMAWRGMACHGGARCSMAWRSEGHAESWPWRSERHAESWPCRCTCLQALTSPISGLVGDRYDRSYVVAFGCLLWGVMTAAIGLSRSLGQALVSCAGRGPVEVVVSHAHAHSATGSQHTPCCS